jgi:hypothetical protein
MTFCGWSGTTSELTLLDAKTLKGITGVKVLAVPATKTFNALEPTPLVELDWQPDHVKVTACGETKRVPFVAE